MYVYQIKRNYNNINCKSNGVKYGITLRYIDLPLQPPFQESQDWPLTIKEE